MFGNETFDDEDVTVDDMTSYVSVNALKQNFGTYICYVKNRMGDGVPCELEVTGKFLSNHCAGANASLSMRQFVDYCQLLSILRMCLYLIRSRILSNIFA